MEYARAGWSIKIADLDTGQGSTAKWKGRRDQLSIEPEIPAEKYAAVDRAIRDAEQYDLMILDGPAHAERRGVTMARASDLIIMPAGYSIDDLEPQVETAYELEGNGIDPDKIVFVFCRIQGSLSEDAAVRKYIRKAGLSALGPVFPERASIRQAHNMGKAASEVPYLSVKSRILPLAQAIADKLDKRRQS